VLEDRIFTPHENYGMNFEHMPELHAQYGYPVAFDSLLFRWFRKAKWT
jgi:magnesium transporter